MSKIIIPKSEISKLDENAMNKLRFRVMNKNRNLYSDWSVYNFVQRADDAPDLSLTKQSVQLYSTDQRAEAYWYQENADAEYDIYAKYFYYNEQRTPLTRLGSRKGNSVSFGILPGIEHNSSHRQSVQILVKTPRYPLMLDVRVPIASAAYVPTDIMVFTTDTAHGLSLNDYVDVNIEGTINQSFWSRMTRVISTPTPTSFGISIDVGISYPPTIGVGSYCSKINGKVLFATTPLAIREWGYISTVYVGVI